MSDKNFLEVSSDIKNLIKEEKDDKELVELHSDSNIEEYSEIEYIKLVNQVIEVSKNQLGRQTDSKQQLRNKFTIFFIVLLFIQYGVLVLLLILNASIPNFKISDTLFLTYITSVFVETLGVIVIMVTFAYDNKTENQILNILKAVVKEYKKYSNNDGNDKKEAK